MNEGIEIKNISKVYRKGIDKPIHILDDINFKVGAQEFISVVGYTGCGKTTLLNIIGGLLAPTNGNILINNESVNAALKRHRLGFVFQESSLLPWRNVYDNIKLSAEITGVNNSQAKILNIIDAMHLAEYVDFFPHQISGGMKARVAIARALLIEPAVLLMDEPFGHLDEITRQNMNNLLLEVWSKAKATAIFVTHNIAEAVFLSDRIIVLSKLPSKIIGVVEVALSRPRKDNIRFETNFIRKAKEVSELLLKV